VEFSTAAKLASGPPLLSLILAGAGGAPRHGLRVPAPDSDSDEAERAHSAFFSDSVNLNRTHRVRRLLGTEGVDGI